MVKYLTVNERDKSSSLLEGTKNNLKITKKIFAVPIILLNFASLKWESMFEENSLFTPIESSRNMEVSYSQLFINFINKLEGWKTKCKNLHWAASKKNIHVYLDEFLSILNDYQDALAEGYMGILGQMQPNTIKGIASDSLNAYDFILEVKNGTINFYNKIPKDTIYKGITSDCETFIQNINKYDYLFHLCDVKS